MESKDVRGESHHLFHWIKLGWKPMHQRPLIRYGCVTNSQHHSELISLSIGCGP